MPVDMQRPKRIPLDGGAEAGDLKRIEIDVMDDGSFVVQCIHDTGEEGPMGLGTVGKAKKYTFQDAAAMGEFVMSKAQGAGGGGGEGEEVEPPPNEVPEEEPSMPADVDEEVPEETPMPPGPPPMPVARSAARSLGRAAGGAAVRGAARTARRL